MEMVRRYLMGFITVSANKLNSKLVGWLSAQSCHNKTLTRFFLIENKPVNKGITFKKNHAKDCGAVLLSKTEKQYQLSS